MIYTDGTPTVAFAPLRLNGLAGAVERNDVATLAELLADAADAHHRFEQGSGERDADWPRWYAEYLLGLR